MSAAIHLFPPCDALWLASNPAIGEPIAFVVGEHEPSLNEPDIIEARAAYDELGKRRAINNLRVLGLRNVRAIEPGEWARMKERMGA